MPVKPSAVVKRAVWISRRKTSVSLEDAFWNALGEIAEAKETTRRDLISEIDQTRTNANLSSALRMFVLGYYRGSCE
jgi:predicted DNA-binding ribbon-helix-helix protein